MAWDDAKKAKAIKMYKDANPTPDTSIEIVKDIAEDLEESVNGVRMILSAAGEYIKKDAAAKKDEGAKKEGSTRVSKADSIQSLKDAIEAAGSDVDDDILDKLTGKQAVYLTAIVKKLTK